MASIRLAANHILGLTPFNVGHLQLVYVDDLGNQEEIEVQSPSSGNKWVFYQRDHTHPDSTNYYDVDEFYSYTTLDLGNRSAEDVWSIFVSLHGQFELKSDITYTPITNSNSYISTLLYIMGFNLDDILDDVKDTYIQTFPGHNTNVILDSGTAIELIFSGTDGDDFLNGGALDDIISGGDGNDIIVGGGGVNILDGGDGSNIFAVGEGIDIIIGAGADDRMGFKASLIDLVGAYIGASPWVASYGNGTTDPESKLIPLLGGIGGPGSWYYAGSTYTAVMQHPMDGPMWQVNNAYFEEYSYYEVSEPYYGVSGFSYSTYFQVYYSFYDEYSHEDLSYLVDETYTLTADDLILELLYIGEDGDWDTYWVIVSDYDDGDLGLLLSDVQTVVTSVDSDDEYFEYDTDPSAGAAIAYINNWGDYFELA